MKSAPAITFDFRPSRRLGYTLMGLTLAMMAALSLSGLPGANSWRGVIFFAAIAALLQHEKAGAWRVAWRGDGTWGVASLGAANGEGAVEDEATLIGWHHLGHWIGLRLRLASGRRISLLLLPDNADADTRRRLLVRLRRGESAQMPADMSLLP